jgi:hypothetical protein
MRYEVLMRAHRDMEGGGSKWPFVRLVSNGHADSSMETKQRGSIRAESFWTQGKVQFAKDLKDVFLAGYCGEFEVGVRNQVVERRSRNALLEWRRDYIRD